MENWNRIKEAFDEVGWKISGNNKELKKWLEDNLEDLCTDNFIIRHINAGFAYYE